MVTDQSSAATDNDVTTMLQHTLWVQFLLVTKLQKLMLKLQIQTSIEHYGISFAVNENLSVAYGVSDTLILKQSTSDEESTGISASYTAGSMTFVLVNNKRLMQ